MISRAGNPLIPGAVSIGRQGAKRLSCQVLHSQVPEGFVLVTSAQPVRAFLKTVEWLAVQCL